MARTRRLATNLLLALACTAILCVVLELVLRARFEPRARTLAPNVRTRTTTSEYDVEIVTNRDGFRDGNHANTSMPRIAVIGDSFVFGSGVAFDSLLTRRLHAHNFGVSGTGPFNALYLWREHVRKIDPSVVVVAVYAGNDAHDALREWREAHPRSVTIARTRLLWERVRARASRSRATTAVATGGWNAFGTANPATMDALLVAARKRGVSADSVRVRLAAVPDSLVQDALAFRSNPFNLAEAVLDPDGLRHNLLLDTAELSRGWDALETALRDLHHDVEATGATLLLVCVPAAVQLDATYWWPARLGVRLDRRVLDTPVFQERLARFANTEGLALIDLLPVMRAHPDTRLYYEQDGHWNADGHEVAARAIADWLAPMLSPAR